MVHRFRLAGQEDGKIHFLAFHLAEIGMEPGVIIAPSDNGAKGVLYQLYRHIIEAAVKNQDFLF